MLELLRRQIPKAGEQYHQIRIIQDFQTADGFLISRRDMSLFIQGIADRDVKAIIAFQNFCQHGHGFFRAIFIVSGNKHNMRFICSLRFHSE